MSRRASIGAERFMLETITVADVEALARKDGWTGGTEGMREFCEPNDAAVHTVFRTLDDATAAARAHLATGKSFYGCALIDRQTYQEAHDDQGNRVDCPPTWETEQVYEVAMDGERIEVES